MSVRLNELQNATVGMTVGVVEVLMLQPFNYAKNMTQQKQPISLNPMTMYRYVENNFLSSCRYSKLSLTLSPVHSLQRGWRQLRQYGFLHNDSVCCWWKAQESYYWR